MNVLFILFSTLLFTAAPAESPDAIVGIWQNGTGKGHIQIYKHNNKFFGKIIWLKDAKDKSGNPKMDMKNPDPAKRNKPLIGLVMLRDFEYEKGGEWSGGRLYNPSDGKEYKAYFRLKDTKTLLVRGYVGISVLGKTDEWTRVR